MKQTDGGQDFTTLPLLRLHFNTAVDCAEASLEVTPRPAEAPSSPQRRQRRVWNNHLLSAILQYILKRQTKDVKNLKEDHSLDRQRGKEINYHN